MLAFTNSTPDDVWVAIMWYTPNCPDGGDWSKIGWYHLSPGQNREVFTGDLTEINRYWCFYAENPNGGVWAGQYVRAVQQDAFDWCEWTSSTQSRDVGFRLFDIDSHDDVNVILTS